MAPWVIGREETIHYSLLAYVDVDIDKDKDEKCQ
jgi:hypothetical protein